MTRIRRSLSVVASLLASGLALGACQTSGPTDAAVSAYTAEADSPATLKGLTCSNNGGMGRTVPLTASRVRAGDPAYIEFRGRMSPAIPSGHMYVAFGRLDAAGNPVSRYHIGSYPKGYVVGLYGGALVPMPVELEPSILDCSMGTFDAYRVSLTEEQYKKLLAKVAYYRRNPPTWTMFGFNCNNFAASLGSVAGLREPVGRAVPTFAYVQAYIRANGDGGQISKPVQRPDA
ncbi:hypothetical protein [Mangrovicella endophytica]|uniref:hypothetical protein n=1 Tax=Mangrovicella endophytica TaxID=2066697 RepID=UPI0012FFFDBB|nr:hypothetical protein [Mangrovicella endophytica]